MSLLFLFMSRSIGLRCLGTGRTVFSKGRTPRWVKKQALVLNKLDKAGILYMSGSFMAFKSAEIIKCSLLWNFWSVWFRTSFNLVQSGVSNKNICPSSAIIWVSCSWHVDWREEAKRPWMRFDPLTYCFASNQVCVWLTSLLNPKTAEGCPNALNTDIPLLFENPFAFLFFYISFSSCSASPFSLSAPWIC